jgi:Ca2+-binding RTX toxin-like protein
VRLKLALLAFGYLLIPASADAGEASLNAGFGDVGYVGTANEPNNVTVTAPNPSGNYRWTDNGAGVNMTAVSPCAADNGIHAAECPNIDAQVMFLGLGGGNDFANTSAVDIDQLAFGGDGNDNVTLGDGDDIFIGLDGTDTVHAGGGDDDMGDGFFAFFPFGGGSFIGSGNDQMFGEAGNDRWVVGNPSYDGAGADLMNGGPGVDYLEYTQRPGDLSVTVDNPLLGDGQPGENDNVQQVEVVRTLAGNDFISDNNIQANALNNVFYGMQGNDTLRGGVGNDKLYGGDDQGLAGSGNDTMNGGPGADLFDGGDGTDTADYGDRSDAVTVSMDDVADDGAAGEKDNVLDNVEVLKGGTGRDMLVGSDGRDTVQGGAEGDSIDGGDAADALDGEAGDDVIAARDGAPDTITCGAGSDMVNADTADTVASDCELVDRVVVASGGAEGGSGSGSGGSGGGGTGGGGAAPDDPPILFLVAEGKARISKGLKVHAACNEDCAVRLGVTIPSKTAKKYKVKPTLVTRTRSLKMAEQVTLSLKTAKKNVRRLRKLKKLKVQLVVTATDSAGHERKVTKKLTLAR